MKKALIVVTLLSSIGFSSIGFSSVVFTGALNIREFGNFKDLEGSATMTVLWECETPNQVTYTFDNVKRTFKVIKFNPSDNGTVNWTLGGDEKDLLFIEKVTQRLRKQGKRADHFSRPCRNIVI
jgi:hypothetical protein